MRKYASTGTAVALAGAMLVAACGSTVGTESTHEVAAAPDGESLRVTEMSRTVHLNAPGIVRPIADATLSTKLMGSVTDVLVQEGDVVHAGQRLLRIDARDLRAQRDQAEASLAGAEAVLAEARLHVQRMRELHAEEAAPRAQLDAAESGYHRAAAGVAAARAGAAELAAIASYADVRAPFDGTVARRMVDPGSFATPGAPLLTVQDARVLRVSANVSPDVVYGLERGMHVTAVVEGAVVPARIEGVVAGAAGLFTVNAIVDNADGRLPSTGAAEITLPQGLRASIVVPLHAIHRQGELTGVRLHRGDAVLTRWVRLGPVNGDSVEVVSGLQHGDVVMVPPQTAAAASVR